MRLAANRRLSVTSALQQQLTALVFSATSVSSSFQPARKCRKKSLFCVSSVMLLTSSLLTPSSTNLSIIHPSSPKVQAKNETTVARQNTKIRLSTASMDKLERIESFLSPKSEKKELTVSEETSASSTSPPSTGSATSATVANDQNQAQARQQRNPKKSKAYLHTWTKETIPTQCPFCFSHFDYADPTIDSTNKKHVIEQPLACSISRQSRQPRRPSLLKHRYPWYRRSAYGMVSSSATAPMNSDNENSAVTLPVSSNKCHHVICRCCLEQIHCMVHQERETRVYHHRHYQSSTPHNHHQRQNSRVVWHLGGGGGVGGTIGGIIGRWNNRWLPCPLCRIPKAFDTKYPKIDHELCDMLYAMKHQRGPSLQLCRGLVTLQRQIPKFSSLPLSLWPVLLERVNRNFQRQQQQNQQRRQPVQRSKSKEGDSIHDHHYGQRKGTTVGEDLRTRKLPTKPLPPRTFHIEVLHDLVRHRLVETNEFYGH